MKNQLYALLLLVLYYTDIGICMYRCLYQGIGEYRCNIDRYFTDQVLKLYSTILLYDTTVRIIIFLAISIFSSSNNFRHPGTPKHPLEQILSPSQGII